MKMTHLRRLLLAALAFCGPQFVCGSTLTDSFNTNVNYLVDIQKLVDRLMDEGATKHDLLEYDIEQFNRSRIPLGGLVQQFHANNMLYLWEKARVQRRQQRANA